MYCMLHYPMQQDWAALAVSITQMQQLIKTVHNIILSLKKHKLIDGYLDGYHWPNCRQDGVELLCAPQEGLKSRREIKSALSFTFNWFALHDKSMLGSELRQYLRLFDH